MGSGAATPLLQALARAYAAGHPSLPLRVEPSVGSAGGIAAATDGAVDLGLVGRPLGPTEAVGLDFLPLALDAVVLAAAADVARDGLSREEVRRLYAGDRALGLTLLLRDPAETANAALEGAYPELRALREAGAAAARFRVLDHDDAMAHALLTTPRAVGVFSFGAIQTWGLPLRPLALEGVHAGGAGAGQQAVAGGASPWASFTAPSAVHASRRFWPSSPRRRDGPSPAPLATSLSPRGPSDFRRPRPPIRQKAHPLGARQLGPLRGSCSTRLSPRGPPRAGGGRPSRCGPGRIRGGAGNERAPPAVAVRRGQARRAAASRRTGQPRRARGAGRCRPPGGGGKSSQRAGGVGTR